MTDNADHLKHFSLVGVEAPDEPVALIPGISISPIRPRVTLDTFFKKLSEETMVFGVTFGPHISSIVAEISISDAAASEWGCDPSNLAWLTTTLFRLRRFEFLSCPICTSFPMSRLADATDKSLKVHSVEFNRGRLQPQVDSAKVDLSDRLEQQWCKYYLPILIRLNKENQRFFFALHSYDASRFSEDVRFSLATLWTGVESLFSKGGAELSFKMAAAWASFLEPFGPRRNTIRKEISKLYNVRSKAVHGQPLGKYKPTDALQRTRELVQLSLCKILEEERVPEVDELMERVFE